MEELLDRCSEELQELCESVASSSTLDMSFDEEDMPFFISSHDTLRFFRPFNMAEARGIILVTTAAPVVPACCADVSAAAPAVVADDSAALA